MKPRKALYLAGKYIGAFGATLDVWSLGTASQISLSGLALAGEGAALSAGVAVGIPLGALTSCMDYCYGSQGTGPYNGRPVIYQNAPPTVVISGPTRPL